MTTQWQQVRITSSFDSLIGMNVRFWAKLPDMVENVRKQLQEASGHQVTLVRDLQ